MKFLIMTLTAITVSLVMKMLLYMLVIPMNQNHNKKNSPFECGFQQMTESSSPFSLPFFSIMLMFLLFDIEILLLCFYPLYSFETLNLYSCMWLILMLMLLSTFMEWSYGMLKW